MKLWKVARLDWADLGPAEQAACLEWIAGLGQDPRQCRPPFVVSQDERDGTYHLHLSRYVRDADGKTVIDHAAGDMWTEPVVVPIDEPPAWLLPAYQKQLAETGGQ